MEPLYHIGDVVRIRQWDDMKAQFGVDHFGDIQVPYQFTTGMKKFCGREFTVRKTARDSYACTYQYFFVEPDATCSWSEEMLEPVEDECEISFDADDLNDLLGF